MQNLSPPQNKRKVLQILWHCLFKWAVIQPCILRSPTEQRKVLKILWHCPFKWAVIQPCILRSRAGNSLIHSSLIRSFAHPSFTHSLISLKSNERLWGICSDRSRQMRDREQIDQVTQRKWATMSKSLSSLKTNEQLWVIRSGRSEEMSEWAIRSKNVG